MANKEKFLVSKEGAKTVGELTMGWLYDLILHILINDRGVGDIEFCHHLGKCR